MVILASSATAALAQRAPRWQRSGPSFAQVNSIAVAPDDSDTVYAAAWDQASGQSAVFRSTDAGDTWVLLTEALVGDMASTIQVDPRLATKLFATAYRSVGETLATRLYVSVDAGATWQLRQDFPSSCGGPFAFDTERPSVVYLSLHCSGQIHASYDGGSTWVKRTTPSTALISLEVGPDGFLYGVAEDGIFRSPDGGLSWGLFAPPPEPCPFITALAIDPANADVLLAGTGSYAFRFHCGGVFRSVDGGRSWNETLSHVWVTDLVIDPAEPSKIYASAGFVGGFFGAPGGAFASEDGGETWRNLELPTANAYQLALSGSGRHLYASTNSGVYQLPIRKTRVVAPR